MELYVSNPDNCITVQCTYGLITIFYISDVKLALKMDTALNAVDTAIDRIKREVQIQKKKSDSMCKYKTAHNWQVIIYRGG